MAQNMQNTSSVGTHSFDKSLNKDLGNLHMPPNVWGHARNAINNSKTGDLGKIGNEPANQFCTQTPYQIIGGIHLEADKWAVFSTDGTNSEIGLYIENCCAYRKVVNDPCLKFSAEYLIKGTSRATGDCNFNLYFDDGNNVSRTMTMVADNICDPAIPDSNVYTNPNSPIPWLQICHDSNNVYQTSPGVWPTNYKPVGCIICENTAALNCDNIRLASLVNPICATAKKGPGIGTLPNGSYMAAIAYAMDGQKVSDYYLTNVVGLFDHDNTASSLEITIDQIDNRFNEMIVVLVSIVNQQMVARLAAGKGIYSTHQTRLSFDVIETTWTSVPVEQLPIRTPIFNKSDAMYNTGPYLLRVGPTSKFDFNYQPLANQIRTKWVSVEYPHSYYRRAGINTGYMRDEVYAFFVRWIYDTGDKSSSYHIPGRPAVKFNPQCNLGFSIAQLETNQYIDANTLTGDTKLFETYNTAVVTSTAQSTLPDGGVQVAEGYMGYWESSEFYPDDKDTIWNPSAHSWSQISALTPYSGSAPFNTLVPSDYDLCGKPIRHHKFPEDNLNDKTQLFDGLNQSGGTASKIRVMGVKFENVLPPRDNAGNLIPGIVGYEILRGTRNGNKTVVAKGIINNMGLYNIPGSTKQGAYPNYPYNDVSPDPFLSTTPTNWGGKVLGQGAGYQNINPQSNFSNDLFTFHSPETNFTNPYLLAKELKVYGEINGEVTGKFDFSEKHPKEKLITDFSFLMAAIGGIGIGALSMNGEKLTTRTQPRSPGYSQTGWFGIGQPGPGTTFTPNPAPSVLSSGAQPTFLDASPFGFINAQTGLMNGAKATYQGSISSGAAIGLNFLGISSELIEAALQSSMQTVATSDAFSTATLDIQQKEGALKRMGPFAAASPIGFALPMFLYFFTEGTETILEFIRSMIRFRNFALRYHSHGFYQNFIGYQCSIRKEIDDQEYLGPQLTDFAGVRVNNLYRGRAVALKLKSILPGLAVTDRTRYKVSDIFIPLNFGKKPTDTEINTNTIMGGGVPKNSQGKHQIASSHYTALKQKIVNQYGQLTDIYQLPIPGCMTPVIDPNISDVVSLATKTQVLFGGDIYVARYTEKNTFFYFYDWLYDQLDGAQLNYNEHQMVAYPTYWANFDQFETSDFTTSILSALNSGSTVTILGQNIKLPPTPGSIWGNAITPADYYCLDNLLSLNAGNLSVALSNFKYSVQNAWFYLFNSGVRDFYVESEVNLGYRDYGDMDSQIHYDYSRYTDTKALFDTAIIKSGNYYKYNQSLSIAKLPINYSSWGNTQTRDYDPYLVETCYDYRPRRAIYSLPFQFEGKKDNWLIFLANNYYDFLSRVTCIKPINKNGAIIFFEAGSPVEFQGTDQLQTSLGIKLTIGDGGLFSQPMQALTNADRPYEYGSCQDRLSVINTPAGVFWMSQNQGKIFNLTSNMDPISDRDLKWWFNSYLPYKLTVLFPTFQLTDNPVIGIGCQAIYDNENGLAYFCKRDFILRTGFSPTTSLDNSVDDGGNIFYTGGDNFIYKPTGLQIKLGDPMYFEDASWTVSYDVKTKGWLGWHDWHPELLIPGKNTFMSTVKDQFGKGSIWIHNQRCDLYCNYYGVDYPFEIEYMTNTPQQVNTLRSIEYYMEVYKYAQNCYDRFHVLDYNFDEAVVYNTEQCSGLLRLTPTPRPDPTLILQYPIINPTFIDILFSKIENKYRFNQFWDITDDRGEYPLYPLPAGPQRMIWNTGANGYVKVLNPANLNYSKVQTQRKKFRHYTQSVFLRKRVILGQQMRYKILLALANNKQLNSPR